MKAITYSKYGTPDVLELRKVDKPVPEDNEVLIRVRAAEATKSDCEMRSFRFSVNWFWPPLRLAVGVIRPRRKVLGGRNALHFIDYMSVMLRSVITTRFSDKNAMFAFARETRDELSTLTQMIEDGKILPIVDKVYSMEQAADAHRMVETEKRKGAIVIAIGDCRDPLTARKS